MHNGSLDFFRAQTRNGNHVTKQRSERKLRMLKSKRIIGILAAILLPALARAREAARRASCANNLKQFSLIFKMYAGEAKGSWPGQPKWSPWGQNAFMAFDSSVVFPEYWTDPAIARCPSDPGGDFGATWVSVHHGGGVGIGYSIHAGMVIVCDGTEEASERLERVLTGDPGMGIVRHVDAGYERAIDFAARHDVRIPMR